MVYCFLLDAAFIGYLSVETIGQELPLGRLSGPMLILLVLQCPFFRILFALAGFLNYVSSIDSLLGCCTRVYLMLTYINSGLLCGLLDISRRISYFLWMIAHARLPDGTWAGAAGHDPICVRCPQHVPEPINHCLWICPTSHAVWRVVFLLLTRVGFHAGFVTWGSISWLMPFTGPSFVL